MVGTIVRNPTGTDLTISGQTQGDVLYFNGTAWVRLAAGTSGQLLKTQGAGANPIFQLPSDLAIASQAAGDVIYFNGTNWIRLAIGTANQRLSVNAGATAPEWQTVAAASGGNFIFKGGTTIAGAAATSISVASLDLDTDVIYMVTANLDNASANANGLSLYYNADTTATNYYEIRFTHDGASAAYGSSNNYEIGAMTSNNNAIVISMLIMKDQEGRVRAMVRNIQFTAASSALFHWEYDHIWKTAGTNVTSLTIVGSQANGLAIGSTLNIWKLTTA